MSENRLLNFQTFTGVRNLSPISRHRKIIKNLRSIQIFRMLHARESLACVQVYAGAQPEPL